MDLFDLNDPRDNKLLFIELVLLLLFEFVVSFDLLFGSRLLFVEYVSSPASSGTDSALLLKFFTFLLFVFKLIDEDLSDSMLKFS